MANPEKKKAMARKKAARHVPPSRLRYEASHPTIAMRVSREIYDRLLEIREETGQSWADLMKVALELQKPVLEPRKPNKVEMEEARRRGWQAAMEKYRVTYACNVCKGAIEVNTPDEKKAISQYRTEQGWGHGQCHDKNR